MKIKVKIDKMNRINKWMNEKKWKNKDKNEWIKMK